MNKNILITPITTCMFVFIFVSHAFAQIGSWHQKANFGGTNRSNAVGFSIGNYGYIGTGYTGTPQKDFWRYDPTNDSWTQMANFGGNARYAATGFSIGNYGYIGTGYDGSTYYKDFYKYDPTGNSWSSIANFSGNGRYYATSFSIINNGYVGTGMDGSTAYQDFYKYNSTTNSWSAIANYGTKEGDCFAFAINSKGYVGCGRNFAGSTFYNSFYQYDTLANSWTAKANFGGTTREGVGAFVIGNYGYAGTGSISSFSTQYTDFYKYDPVGNAWSAVATFIGTKRTNAATFAVGNFGYLGTGYTGAYVNTFYQYDLCGVTLTVTPTAPSCNGGSNASISTSVAGGTGSYTYLWNNGQSTSVATNLLAGGYTITVTDGVGCTQTATVNVSQPTALVGNVTTVTNASCYSMCNGKIVLTTSGATPPYSYAWSPSTNTTSSATGLCAGNYTVTVTDSKGCTTSRDTIITEPVALSDSIGGTATTKSCLCDGSANVTVTGGTSPYIYNWSTSGTSQTITGLCGAISLTVQITDSKGCLLSDTVHAAGSSAIAINMSSTPATCPSCPDGTATGTPSGGTSPFTYSWNTTPAQTTQTATGLIPGMYQVCVTDADTCSKCDSTYVGFAFGVAGFILENISMCPNPTNGEFSIYNLPNNAELSIYNFVGEKVFESTVNNKRENVNLLSLQSGIYFLQIKTGEGIVTKKIILNK